MIKDYYLSMGDAQAVTSSAATTNVIDTATAGDAIDGCYVEFLVDTAATATGAATVTFELQDSADDATFATIASSTAIGKATLVAGYTAFRVRVPLGVRRYIRGYYTVATGPLTAGKFDCYLVKDVQMTQP